MLSGLGRNLFISPNYLVFHYLVHNTGLFPDKVNQMGLQIYCQVLFGQWDTYLIVPHVIALWLLNTLMLQCPWLLLLFQPYELPLLTTATILQKK